MTGTLSNTVVDSGSLFADGVAAMLPGLIAPMLSEHAARRADVDMARLTGNLPAQRGAGVPYELLPGGVACIGLSGMLLQRPGLLLRILFGAADLVECHDALAAAGADAAVRSIVLRIDSPGGVVNGPPEIAALIEDIGRSKPVVAWSGGMLASAAYWIASACHSIYISGPTVTTGSIGVVATHRYQPDPAGGITTEITAGKLKSIASSSAPLSVEGRQHIQNRVDYLGGVFHQAVARGRGMPVAKVASLEAATFTGAQGMDAGLVDGIVSFDVLVESLAANPTSYMRRRLQAPSAQGARAVTAAPLVTATPLPSQAAVAAPLPPMPPAPSLAEQKAQAAKNVSDAFAMHGPGFRVRVQPPELWQAQAQARAKRDGCDFLTALKRVGFVHSLVSFPPVGPPDQGKVGAEGGAVVPGAVEVQARYADSPPFSVAELKEAGQAYAVARDQHDAAVRPRKRTAEEWNASAHAFAQVNGCSFAQALRSMGYVHPAISVAVSPR